MKKYLFRRLIEILYLNESLIIIKPEIGGLYELGLYN
jgi:hypothetical protein